MGSFESGLMGSIGVARHRHGESAIPEYFGGGTAAVERAYGLSSLTLISAPSTVAFSAGPTVAPTVSLAGSRLRLSLPGILEIELLERCVKVCECQANQFFDRS